MTFGNILSAVFKAVPDIHSAVTTFQSIGHSKESTAAKVRDIIETSATVAEEDVPIPIVQAIAGVGLAIIEGVFGPASPAPAAGSQLPAA